MTKRMWCVSLLSLAAAPALAQSSVTLYGRIDTSIEYANFGPNHVVRMGSGDIFATQFGLKGSEDLGGGYRAIFKLENGFNSANGTLGNNGALFGREAWVGLSGPFGAMQAGRQLHGAAYVVRDLQLAGQTAPALHGAMRRITSSGRRFCA